MCISHKVTTDGHVHVTVQGTIISGIMDNSGTWAVQASISDLNSLISEKNIDSLGDAGCSMNKKTIKIEGPGIPPAQNAISGDVSGRMKCKRLGLTIVTLATTGTLSASS
jgi:hypothetical protein